MRLFRRPSWVIALSIALLAGGLAGGCTSQSDDSEKLTGTVWQADEIRGTKGLEPAISKNVTAEFESDRISGNGGVNQYSGPYSTEPGNAIKIGEVASTMMAGPPDVSAQEQAYFSALAKATRYVVTADSLKLQDENANVLVSYVPLKETPLTGTEWECIAYNNGRQALVSLIATSQITATFSEDEKLSGNASVNTYNTTYSADQGEIKIDGPIATTMMAGPPELMTQEQEYLAALPKATRYKITGDKLDLRDDEGAAIAMYKAK